MKNLFAIIILLQLASCNKSDDSQSPLDPPQNVIVCETIGLGDTHALGANFQGILDEYVAMGFPGMTALVYTPDEGLWIGSSGRSNISDNIAAANCSSYFSGSVAKLYTVASAMTLYEDGLLDLDENISNYLPQILIDNLPNAQTATFRHLMNHAAGMPDHDDEDALNDYIENNLGNLPSAIDQLSYLFDNQPNFPAGSTADYSSAHTVTLALAIDSLTNQHHSNLISDKIINRLGLQETYYKNEIGYPNPMNLVNGYFGTTSDHYDITIGAINYANGSQGDAGIIATAHDYYLFMKGLVSGNVVNSTTLNTMLNEPLLFDDGTHGFGFGLGFFLVAHNGELVKYGHGGETLGGMSHVYYYPQQDSYLVILTNTSFEDEPSLDQEWAGSVLVNTGSDFLIDKFENYILD